MFTGIIEGVGEVRSVRRKDRGLEVEVRSDVDLEKTSVGDSVSVNGCCLTVTSRLGKSFWAFVSEETVAVSTLGGLKVGDPVNLERALALGSRLDGHIVQGHVDGMGRVEGLGQAGEARVLMITAPEGLARYIVEKGSIAVDGVSLTVNSVTGDRFSVMVIPHTQLKTTFERLRPGSTVNLEVDIIGKYVEKLAFLDTTEYRKTPSKITEAFLKKHGF